MNQDIEQENSSENSSSLQGTSLLFCLECISINHGRGHSLRSLTIGLPLENGDLTPGLFIRAVNRLSYECNVIQGALESFIAQKTPFILLTSKETGLFVEKVSEEGLWILLPDSPDAKLVSFEEVQKVFIGYGIVMTPLHYKEKEMRSKKDHWLWGTLYSLRNVYLQVLFASFLTNFFSLLVPLYSMNVYDRVVPNNSLSTLWVLSVGIIIVMVFDFILKIIKSYFVDAASRHADIMLSSKLLEKVMGIHLADRRMSSGELAGQVKELETIREFFSSVTLLSLVDIPFALLFLILIGYVGGIYMFAVCLTFIILVVLVSWIMRHVIAEHVHRGFATTNRKSGFLIETILGLETIKAFRAEGKNQRFWEHLSAHNAEHHRESNFFTSLTLNFIQTASNLNYICLVIMGVYLISQKELSMGGIIACSILGGRALAPFVQAVSLSMRLSNVILSYKSINVLMSLKSERASDHDYFTKHSLEGRIRFQDVTFRYPDQPVDVLKNVSFEIKTGDKVAIIGKLGSGKTTLEKLLMGFYSPDSGLIFYDDVDIRQIDPADLRGQIGYVSQDIYLFSGNILDNILLGEGKFTAEEIYQALSLAGVIHFIQNHPAGMNYQVGEGGRYLSGGQKQAIAIARAFLHNPNVLIMDEPTSMMDQHFEKLFLDNLRKYIEKKTVLFITHNPNLLSLATKILLLEDGRVKFFGEKKDFLDLLKSENAAGKTSKKPSNADGESQ